VLITIISMLTFCPAPPSSRPLDTVRFLHIPLKCHGTANVMPDIVMVICAVISIWSESTSFMASVAALRMSTAVGGVGVGVALAPPQAITSRASTPANRRQHKLFHLLLPPFSSFHGATKPTWDEGYPSGRRRCRKQGHPETMDVRPPCAPGLLNYRSKGRNVKPVFHGAADRATTPSAAILPLTAGDQVATPVGVGQRPVAGSDLALSALSTGRAAAGGEGGGPSRLGLSAWT